jgi:3-deoxy-manno-octulosonate cytidylyltransferase (CMP-KDO synthetase)
MLAQQTGRPLVQHVVDQALKCRRISQVIVAVDDERIAAALRPFGTRCMMTDANHPSGSDRVAEVARKLGEDAGCIVNVQGDEPEIDPATIDALAGLVEESEIGLWTAATPFPAGADVRDPNLVKVTFSKFNRAMYFSRSVIPYHRDPASGLLPAYYLHVGVYAYRRQTLIRLAGLKPTPCETAEKLEQLRALENDVPIGVTVIDHAAHGIDTPQQYAAFVERFVSGSSNGQLLQGMKR